MKWSDINNLDFSNAGAWPGWIKGVAAVLVFAAIVGAGVWYDTQHVWADLEASKAKEPALKAEFEEKQEKAANLEAYRTQMAEMKETFGAMLRQLPNKTEVAELLVDVSQTGLSTGLEFELFKPQGERPVEFYAELPIQMQVRGTYHQFGEFISGLAALPRIVTLHNFTIESGKRGRGGDAGTLAMKVTAKTYRYLDEEGRQ